MLASDEERRSVTHRIDRFVYVLDAYRKVHEHAFSSDNITSSFKATGLVLDNSEAVLLKL